MNTKEDFTLSIRSLLASPLESMLLVLGLALSIGATASGLGMFAKASDESKALLQQVEYREILVTSKESSADMNVPISIQPTDENITLSIADLDAGLLSPSIEYAYLSDRARLRFNTADDARNRPNDDPAPENETAPETTQDSAQETGQGTSSNQNSDAPESDALNEPRERVAVEMAEVDGPSPIVDELSAYEVTPDFFSAMRISTTKGSLFTEQEMLQGAKVLVLGFEAAKSLFEDGVSLNREVASFNNVYSIVGVLEKTGTTIDYNAYLPSKNATQNAANFGRFGGGATLHFAVADVSDLSQAQSQLTQYFNSQYGDDVLNIQVPREAAEAATDRSQKIAIITMVLALAGLLIANVNVSNILYSRALRRRKQVGILKALGASKNNIFIMFLKESGVLLALGGLIGVGIALAFSSLISADEQSGLPLYAVLLGILVSCLITLLFTLVPALQASKTPPAIAMRVE